jgi:hypothetical protein
MRRHVCAFCVGILLACTSGLAVAGEKEEAKQLFESGLKLMRVDDFAGASADFERSIALYPTQNSLFNLANCYRALQRFGDAVETMQRLERDFAGKLKPEIKASIERQLLEIQLLVASLTLETAPSDATITVDGKVVGTGPTLGPLLLAPGEHDIEVSRPDHRKLRRTLKLEPGVARTEKLVLELDTGSLVVRANLAGAAVFVDGQPIGTTPLANPVALTVGKHALALRAAEHEEIERTIELQAGERQVLDILLIAKPAPVTAAPMVAAPPPPPALTLAVEQSPKPKSRALRVVTWSALAGSVAAGALAGTFAIILNRQNSDFQKYNDLYAEYGRPEDDTKRRGFADDMRLSAGIAIGCGIAAGALAATALVTYLVDSRTTSSESSVSFSPNGFGVRF